LIAARRNNQINRRTRRDANGASPFASLLTTRLVTTQMYTTRNLRLLLYHRIIALESVSHGAACVYIRDDESSRGSRRL
jgi:hypothetical protein